MWTYRQRTGELLRDSVLVGRGYSGWDDGDGVPEPGEGKNDPDEQERRHVGPIPVGLYVIGPAFTHPTKGELVMRLIPKPGTNTFERSGFLLHGDSRRRPGAGSEGCIVQLYDVRLLVAESEDHDLEVVRDAPSEPLPPAPVPPATPVGRTSM